MNPNAPESPPPTSPPPPAKPWTVPAVLLLMVVSGLVVLAALIFAPFVAPIVVALAFASVGHPVYAWLLRRLGETRRALAAAIACVAVVTVVIAPLGWIGWSIVEEAQPAAEVVGRGGESVASWLEEREWFRRWQANESFGAQWAEARKALRGLRGTAGGEAVPGEPRPDSPASPSPVDSPAGAWSGDITTWMAQKVGGILGGAVELVIEFFLMVFILFFFLKDGPVILGSLRRTVPLAPEYQRKVIETFRAVTRSVVRGSFATALAQGLLAAVAFLVVGLPAVFWGVMVALSSLVPVIGTALVMVPLAVFKFVDGRTGQGIFLSVVAVAVGALEDVLRPLLVGQTVRLHQIWLLLSILGAIRFFGPMGLLYGPLVLVLLGTLIAVFAREEATDAAWADSRARQESAKRGARGGGSR